MIPYISLESCIRIVVDLTHRSPKYKQNTTEFFVLFLRLRLYMDISTTRTLRKRIRRYCIVIPNLIYEAHQTMPHTARTHTHTQRSLRIHSNAAHLPRRGIDFELRIICVMFTFRHTFLCGTVELSTCLYTLPQRDTKILGPMSSFTFVEIFCFQCSNIQMLNAYAINGMSDFLPSSKTHIPF